MAGLTALEIGHLLAPYLESKEAATGSAGPLLDQLARYLELLLRWNERTNLTAIRDPAEMVRRHFGESLFLAQRMRGVGSALDLGSGAGFPGIPVQLWYPELRVTLAESQGKKASFLREVVRSLSLQSEVWGGRVEDILPDRCFESVMMRAVDQPGRALTLAKQRSRRDVWLLGVGAGITESMAEPGSMDGLENVASFPLPQRRQAVLIHMRVVPRGT